MCLIIYLGGRSANYTGVASRENRAIDADTLGAAAVGNDNVVQCIAEVSV